MSASTSIAAAGSSCQGCQTIQLKTIKARLVVGRFKERRRNGDEQEKINLKTAIDFDGISEIPIEHIALTPGHA
jgi:hypothetical protein